MFTRVRDCFLFGLLVALPTQALALDKAFYLTDKMLDTSGNWSISVNVARQSCFMSTKYDNGTIIALGSDNRDDQHKFYLLFVNPHWRYDEGKKYNLVAAYTSGKSWNTVNAIGVATSKLGGVAVEGIKREFVDQFAAMNSLKLTIDGQNFGGFDLSGTRNGLKRLYDCIDAVANGNISLDEITPAATAKAEPPQPAADSSDDAPQPAATSDDNSQPPETGNSNGNTPSDQPATDTEQNVSYTVGTGFFVNSDGYLMTNAHVIEGCRTANIWQLDGSMLALDIVARDTTDDLAILRLNRTNGPFARFRSLPETKLGEPVVVFGFPLPDDLSRTGNLTTGLVSSLIGGKEDKDRIQITAPVQHGNSGGPVADQSGRIIGIVVAGLGTNVEMNQNVVQVDVIQNVNFAIKSSVAETFLSANNVHYELEPQGDDLKTTEVASRLQSFTVQLACHL